MRHRQEKATTASGMHDRPARIDNMKSTRDKTRPNTVFSLLNLGHTGKRLSESPWHRHWTAFLHENQGWSPVGSRGGHVSRRFDLSRPTLFVSNDRFKSPNPPESRGGSAAGVVVVFIFIFLRERARWMRRSGRTRRRVRLQWLQQRGQNPHATHRAQGRAQPQVAWAPSSQHGRSKQDTALVNQGSDRAGKLGGRIWDLGGRPMHRHWNPLAPLPRARVGVRLQPAPAAESSHTILTQADWCAVRAAARCELGSSQSSRPWSQEPECFGTDRSL